jgi:hypothetical protein
VVPPVVDVSCSIHVVCVPDHAALHFHSILDDICSSSFPHPHLFIFVQIAASHSHYAQTNLIHHSVMVAHPSYFHLAYCLLSRDT